MILVAPPVVPPQMIRHTHPSADVAIGNLIVWVGLPAAILLIWLVMWIRSRLAEKEQS